MFAAQAQIQKRDIELAVKKQRGNASITYNVNPQLSATVRSFGVLDDSVAREDWGWTRESFGLPKAVKAFFGDVENYPDRIKAIELY